MNFHRYTLKNGLRVIIVPENSVGSATSMVLVGAGSRYENKNNNGISHFLEHMAFKGTKKRPTALEIATLIDGIGAEQNAFTGKEVTGYYIKSSSNHVELALDVLSDMLANSLFREQEIAKERGVILEEINLYEDTPVRKIGDVFERLLYGDTPMGWDTAGEKETIKSIQRKDFLAYMRRLYSAHNIVLVISGRVNLEQIKQKIEQYFLSLPPFKVERAEKVREVQGTPSVYIKHKKTEQAHLALGVRTVGFLNEKDRYPLSVLSAILGGGMSSRLFHEVREKRGLAYYVRAVSENYVDCGYLSTFAGVDPKRIDEAIKVIVEEYQKVRNSQFGIRNSELKKAKEYIKGHLILELEDTRSVATFYGSQELLERKIKTPEQVIEKIKKMKLSDIERVAKTYFKPSRLNLAVIGDFDQASDGERFRKLLD